jgi:hypothetical protein
MSSVSVYLAGKIYHTDWRHQIVRGLRSLQFDCPGGSQMRISEYPICQDAIAPGVHYSGPYFVSCDRGCYHGTNTHGVMPMDYDCIDAGPHNRHEVMRTSQHQIERASLFFAWIEDLTCFGNLAEIGYAKATSTFVAICGPARFDDLWFAYEMADATFVRKSAEIAFKDTLSVYLSRHQ